MSFQKKSFDFFGKMNDNKDFYIFDYIFPENKSDIISIFNKFKTAPEFFQYYTNKDVKLIFQTLEKLDIIYSNLLKENNSNNFKSKIDIYVSNLSEIFLLFNLISENKKILDKAIIQARKNLDIFYFSNQINTINQKKINNYLLNLLGTENTENKNYIHSLFFSNDNINKCSTFHNKRSSLSFFNENYDNKNTEIKIIDHSINNSSLNHEITHDITNHTNNNSKSIEDNVFIDFTTPQFPGRIIDNNNNYILNDPNLNDDNYDKLNKNIIKQESLNSNNEELNKNYSKKESIRSLYTLASKSKFICQEEKVKGTSSKFKDITLEEKYHEKRRNSIYHKKRNNRFQFIENKNDSNNNKNIEDELKIKKSNKKTFSSTNLKTSKEKKIIKDLLVYVNDLYKKEIINYDEKLKLKVLIISKYKKLQNLYLIYYENNKDILIKELKKLIN